MESITAGPRRTPGAKDNDGPAMLGERDAAEFLRKAPAEEPEKEPETQKTGVLELSREQTTALNLVLTRVQLAEAEHKLAMIQLKETQTKRLNAARDEAVVLAKISQKFGIPRIKAIKVVGPNSIAFEAE